MVSLLSKKVTTEVTGSHFSGIVNHSSEVILFELLKFKVPNKPPLDYRGLFEKKDIEIAIAELQEVSKILSGSSTQVISTTIMSVSDFESVTLEGSVEALSQLDVVSLDGVVKVIGEGTPVTQYVGFWGSDAVQEEGIYFAIKLVAPIGVSDKNAKIKTFQSDGTPKISDFTNSEVLVQRIFAGNKESGREIEIAWDGVNYEKLKLDFTGVTGI